MTELPDVPVPRGSRESVRANRSTVRAATTDDAARVALLRRAWWEEDGRSEPGDDPGFEDVLAGWFADQLARGARAWLAERDGEPVGMLVMFVHDRMPAPGRPVSRWGYVGNVFVLPGHRDQGTGRVLLDAALTSADEAGLVRVVLNPSPRSVPFYARAGFTRDHPLIVRER